jgi:hypothetical protein
MGHIKNRLMRSRDSSRMNRPPIRIDKVFDDPHQIRTLVKNHGPYRAMTAYLPASPRRGGQPSATESKVLPWFRGTWAMSGQSLVDGAKPILENLRFREVASQLFDAIDVAPNTVIVNVNAPMPAGAIHVDIPSFHGATRDRYPIQLLQAMGSSGLFEPWRILEAGAVVWLYEGLGGAFDYWPMGFDGPMLSEHPPFTNRALVADNDRMYHRIGWIGDPDPVTPLITRDSQIRHVASGWVITDGGRTVQTYSDEQIRISIVWKGRVKSGFGSCDHEESPLTFERIVQVFVRDLNTRGIEAPTPASPLSDKRWLELVHSTYYEHVEPPERALGSIEEFMRS